MTQQPEKTPMKNFNDQVKAQKRQFLESKKQGKFDDTPEERALRFFRSLEARSFHFND